ncbi:MAG: glycosyltransferase [Candidatus Marsarchaeota archaeon]|nr:glycosyltransferase [Candidatus Marsarchaeota archaeon]
MQNKFFGTRFTFRLFTVALFILLAVAGFGFSAYLFVVSKSLYMYIISTMFLALSIIAGLFNISASIMYYRSYFYGNYLEKIKQTLKPMESFPTVAVAVPVYNENPDMVKKTFDEILTMNYPKDKIRFYLLDDSTKGDVIKELRSYALRKGVVYMHRRNRKGYKAGAMNKMLKTSKEEFLAIFDYDEKLVNKNFLMDLLPYFQDEKLSYLQTEKTHSKGNLFSDSVKMFDAFFFKFIEPARALNNTAIFAGSCGIIRMRYLKKMGGFPEYVIEDTFFSFKSDISDYKSIYVPKVYALGKPIKTFTELVKQQWRYNYGDTQFLKYFFKNNKYFNKDRSTSVQKMDYLVHGLGLNYLSVVLIMFTVISILIVFSAAPFVNLTVQQLLSGKYLGLDLEIFGSLAFLLSFLVPVILTKIYFNSITKGFMLFALNFALAFVRTKAAIAAVLKKSPAIHWNRNNASTNLRGLKKLLFSIMNTKIEVMFSGLIFTLSLFAVMNNHFTGGLWLLLYGFMYLFTTIFLYKYG